MIYKAHVLLYVRNRGGSTFSSEFFNRHQDVWYLFEPLRHNDINNRKIYNIMDNVTAIPIMEKLFSCYLDPLFKLDLPKNIQEFLSAHAFCQLPNQNEGCKWLRYKLPQKNSYQNSPGLSKLYELEILRKYRAFCCRRDPEF